MVTPYGLTKEDKIEIKYKCKQILKELSKKYSSGAYVGEKAIKILNVCREEV